MRPTPSRRAIGATALNHRPRASKDLSAKRTFGPLLRLAIPLACLALLAVPCPAQDNVLLVLMDDVGVDKVGCYGIPGAPPTPHLDRLASKGARFDRAYANPVCSPTRATILTGLYSRVHRIGKAIGTNDTFGLNWTYDTLPRRLQGYHSFAFGKWHLSTPQVGGAYHPLLVGFQGHAGSLANFSGAEDYWNWEKSINGSTFPTSTYATIDTTNDVRAALARVPSPWFFWVGYNSAHEPRHWPPGSQSIPNARPADLVDAMVHHLDQEIGRLLKSVDLATTTVIVLGDNGTPTIALRDRRWRGGKGTVYEMGVRVPLIIAGKAVREPGRSVDALVNTTDLFATIVEITGGSGVVPGDSVSFRGALENVPWQPREWVLCEYFTPNGYAPATTSTRAVIGPRYKVMRQNLLAGDFFLDLEADPFEQYPIFQLTDEQWEHYRFLAARF